MDKLQNADPRNKLAWTLVFMVCLGLVMSPVKCTREEQDYGLFADVKKALNHISGYLSTGLNEIVKLGESVQFAEKFYDATVGEECELRPCSSGTKRVPRKGYRPVSNGCGSFGFEWQRDYLPVLDMTRCCEAHDHCYDTCGSDKDECDLVFKKCLYKSCNENKIDLGPLGLKGCKGAAKLMFLGTLALGCQAYQDAQENACQCVPIHSNTEL